MVRAVGKFCNRCGLFTVQQCQQWNKLTGEQLRGCSFLSHSFSKTLGQPFQKGSLILDTWLEKPSTQVSTLKYAHCQQCGCTNMGKGRIGSAQLLSVLMQKIRRTQLEVRGLGIHLFAVLTNFKQSIGHLLGARHFSEHSFTVDFFPKVNASGPGPLCNSYHRIKHPHTHTHAAFWQFNNIPIATFLKSYRRPQ